MKILIFLGALFTLAPAEKLTGAENLERSKTCGKPVDQNTEVAPWLVRINSIGFWTSGSMISSRHVLTISSTILHPFNGTHVWKVNDDVVDSSLCQNGVMELPQTVLDGLSVQECSWTTCDNSKIPTLIPKRGVFIGNCDGTKDPFGMILLDMDADLTGDINPICVEDGVIGNVGDSVELYGLSGNKLFKGQTTIEDCGSLPFSEMSICVKSVGCQHDQGAVYVKKVANRLTAVAAKYYGNCADTGVNQQNSIHAAFPKICEFSGVCKPKPKPPPPTTSRPETNRNHQKENEEKSGEEWKEDVATESSAPAQESGATGVQILALFGILCLYL